MIRLETLDKHLLTITKNDSLSGLRRFLIEFLYFGIKQARSCLFAGLFFILLFSVPKSGIFSIPRYDLLLVAALIIQFWMLYQKLETWDEFKSILLFHIFGFALEVFKTSNGIKSWSYPDFAYTKLFGVPLFSGFMYAAVGSYMIQSWRLLDLRIKHHPIPWMASVIAALIYLNFFTHHFFGDFRWYLTACILGLYARTIVTYRPYDRDRKMPLLLSFILIGFFIWLAENFCTFYGVWKYPNQMGAWASVNIGKWSSWSLLVILTFTIVVNLKHIKKTVQDATKPKRLKSKTQ